MTGQKTVPTEQDVTAFLNRAEPEARVAEGHRLDAVFRRVTGWQPRIWGASIVGYGQYDYRYASGRSGTFLATGFSPRKRELSIYIMPGYQDYGAILSRLGKHRIGKSCLYIRSLSDVDQDALAELIAAGLHDLRRLWPVMPS